MSKQVEPPRLILASSSRYRQQLLSRLGIPFTAISPDVDETPMPGEEPHSTAVRLARNKADAIARSAPGCVVIGSDQVATLDGEQIGKPGTHENALAQLKKMQGRSIIFHTALCVVDNRECQDTISTQACNIQTQVTFRRLPEAQLDAYLRIEQPYDCAGSAKNEGLGIALMESVSSTDPTALTGLPLIALTTMLMKTGFRFFGNPGGSAS